MPQRIYLPQSSQRWRLHLFISNLQKRLRLNWQVNYVGLLILFYNDSLFTPKTKSRWSRNTILGNGVVYNSPAHRGWFVINVLRPTSIELQTKASFFAQAKCRCLGCKNLGAPFSHKKCVSTVFSLSLFQQFFQLPWLFSFEFKL